MSTTVALACASVLYVLSVVDPVAPTHVPRGTRPMLTWLGLDLKIGLFVRAYPSEWWESVGELADGTITDPVRTVAPGAVSDDGFRNSLWMQVPYRLTAYERFGPYVCRRYNASGHDAMLRSWRLTHVQRDPFPPGASAPPERRQVVLEQQCGPSGQSALGH